MKNNSTLTDWLFSPFKFIAGGKALVLGLIFMMLLASLASLSGIYFDGAIDIHTGSPDSPFALHAYFQLCNWLVMTTVFYIAARIVTKSSIRLIDIAGTIALSQAPLIIAVLWGFAPIAHIELSNIDPYAINLGELIDMLKENILEIALTSIVLLIPAIWTIILKYNAYSISANLKGNKGVASFVIALLISELITKILHYFLAPLFV